MKLLMLPHYDKLGLNNGVGQVIYNYHKHLPQVGIEIVTDETKEYNLSASHLGHFPNADIHFSHGLYWGNQISDEMRQTNKNIVAAIRNAKSVIVPSEFVAETFRRDLRLNPYVIPHGVNVADWQHNHKNEGYILWNKNRNSNVCNPKAVYELAKRLPDLQFVTTYCNESLPNIKVVGRLPFDEMQPLIQKASIYLSTAKETFGIGTLEAFASGIPVLGFNWGGTADIATHKQDSYLVNPNDYDALAEGLMWLRKNRAALTQNCVNKATQYKWSNVAEKIKEVCKDVILSKM